MLNFTVPQIEAATTEELFRRLHEATESALRDGAMELARAIQPAQPPVTAPVTRRGRKAQSTNGAQRSETMSTTVVAAPGNKPKFSDLLATATELGTLTGSGKDSFSKLLLKVHEASYLSGVDVDANKHGQGVDDAQKLTEAYVKAQTGATVFDAKAANQRVTTSKVRTMIRLGMFSKGGQGEPLATVNQLMTLRQQMRKDPANCKKLDDASNTLVKFARAQLKRDQMITVAEFKLFLMKPEHEDASEEDILEALRKRMQKAKDGKIAIEATVAATIAQACTKRLTEIAKARGGQNGAQGAQGAQGAPAAP